MKRWFVIQRIIALLIAIMGVTMIPSIGFSLFDGHKELLPFSISFITLFLIGILLWLPVRRHRYQLKLRDGFLIVVFSWVTAGICATLPLYLSYSLELSLINSLFESFSGLTTTGATILTNIDDLPLSILYYRQQLQWIGGMGIVVLAVAILPALRIGGMQLYRVETPGPLKDNKLTPKIAETAKALWYIYFGLTATCALAYFAAGMSLFDAICHAYSTISIGGFSTHDASMGYFNNSIIEAIAMVFMLLAGINFGLHFLAWKRTNLAPYLFNPELRVYLTIFLFVCFLSILMIWLNGLYDSLGESIRHGLFQAISIGTTTGFSTQPFYLWAGALPLILIIASFVGGCAGSTGGGLKVIRVYLIFKQGIREIIRLIHPQAHLPVKMGGNTMTFRVVDSVWGFFALYIILFVFMSILLTASGIDLVTALSAVASCLNNLGPGLGEVGSNYAGINEFAKMILIFAMLLGRLEIFTLLVLLTPAFWRN